MAPHSTMPMCRGFSVFTVAATDGILRLTPPEARSFVPKRKTLNHLLLLCLFAVAAYFAPLVACFYLACGLYDVGRNGNLNAGVARQYFLGNGMLTWLLSPFNALLDLLSLPHCNKGIYRLQDLPAECRGEIQSLIDTASTTDLVGRLEEEARQQPRTMIFFKWFGRNVDTSITIPAYQRKFKYVKTIGVSVFRKRASTSRHFGPLRATLRVLYNLNDMTDDTAFIRVGAVENHWRENKLFIFDDTLLHQSFNGSDQARYCLFVDVLRPSLVSGLFSLVVSGVRWAMGGFNHIFYKYWAVIK